MPQLHLPALTTSIRNALLSARLRHSEKPTLTSLSTLTCIDCGACIPECPVDAIFADTDVPEGEEAWIDRNAEESIDAEIAEGDSPVLAD